MLTPSGLCIGIDPEFEKMPQHLQNDNKGLDTFIREVVNATRHVAGCYKINVAFFERMGSKGMDSLYAAREVIGTSYLILDAKRGDIGNTSAAYADAAFNDIRADAITVAPYMGRDSVGPFMERADKMVYVLALTSNPGSNDFQRLDIDGKPLYKHVMDSVLSWPRHGDVGFVIGATQSHDLGTLRDEYPRVPFLIPGVGAQGGTATDVVLNNKKGPALVNVSRGILYAGSGEDYISHVTIAAEQFASELVGLV